MGPRPSFLLQGAPCSLSFSLPSWPLAHGGCWVIVESVNLLSIRCTWLVTYKGFVSIKWDIVYDIMNCFNLIFGSNSCCASGEHGVRGNQWDSGEGKVPTWWWGAEVIILERANCRTAFPEFSLRIILCFHFYGKKTKKLTNIWNETFYIMDIFLIHDLFRCLKEITQLNSEPMWIWTRSFCVIVGGRTAYCLEVGKGIIALMT